MLQCARSVLLNKIISSEKDLVGIVLFGTVRKFFKNTCAKSAHLFCVSFITCYQNFVAANICRFILPALSFSTGQTEKPQWLQACLYSSGMGSSILVGLRALCAMCCHVGSTLAMYDCQQGQGQLLQKVDPSLWSLLAFSLEIYKFRQRLLHCVPQIQFEAHKGAVKP